MHVWVCSLRHIGFNIGSCAAVSTACEGRCFADKCHTFLIEFRVPPNYGLGSLGDERFDRTRCARKSLCTTVISRGKARVDPNLEGTDVQARRRPLFPPWVNSNVIKNYRFRWRESG